MPPGWSSKTRATGSLFAMRSHARWFMGRCCRASVETLERTYARSKDAHAEELAQHFRAAGVWDKALRYSARAAERARAIYALPEALTHLTRALPAARRFSRARNLIQADIHPSWGQPERAAHELAAARVLVEGLASHIPDAAQRRNFNSRNCACRPDGLPIGSALTRIPARSVRESLRIPHPAATVCRLVRSWLDQTACSRKSGSG